LLCGRETEGRKLALKAVFKDRIDNGIQMSQIMCELSILRRLRHDNIVELVDEFDDKNGPHYIILPLYVVSPSIYTAVK